MGAELNSPSIPLALKEIAVEHFKGTTSWPLARASNLIQPYYDRGDGFIVRSQPSYDENTGPPDNIPVVPLDCRPHITFGRPVNDDNCISVTSSPAHPEWEQIGDPQRNENPAKARYSLQEIVLYKLDPNQIDPAASPWIQVKSSKEGPFSKNALFGSWAPMPKITENGELLSGSDPSIAHTKLWLWSKNPFDYSCHAGEAWDEWFTERFADYPCSQTPQERIIYGDFESFIPGEALVFPLDCTGSREILLAPADKENTSIVLLDKVVKEKYHAFSFDPENGLNIYLTKPAKAIILLFVSVGKAIQKICIDFKK